jgi:hypothetical protein
MAQLTPEIVIAAYVKARADIKFLEDQIEEIKETQKKKEDWLLAQLVTLGAQNLKTGAGTVYQTVKESVTVADWDAVIDFVVAPLKEMLECSLGVGTVDMNIIKGAMRTEFLMKGVGKVAVLETMGEKRENPPIPGVNYIATKTVGVRKS